MTNIINRVVNAVAAADGIDQKEVEPVYEYIDPEILVKLDEQEDAVSWTFTFQYSDHHITLTNNGQILVDGVAHTTDTST